MGNRAVITTFDKGSISGFNDSKLGVYLHWNGGRDSVEAFLEYCKLKDYTSPEKDCYGWARLCQVIGNFFGGDSSVGIDVCSKLDCDNWDNGVYLIKDWKIVGRKFFDGKEQREYELNDMLAYIDSKMPVGEQLGEEFFNAKLTPIGEIIIGDKVFVKTFDGYKLAEVIGFGKKGCIVNGTDVSGIPYVDLFGSNNPETNINNYLRNDLVRRK